MTHNLIEACRQLRLSGLAGSLDLRVQEATSHQLPHVQFLELLLQDELNVRAQRQLERRKKAAGFRDLKPLEDFDWSFNPSIKRSQIFDLATGQFIRQHRDVLLLGPPGVGKSFLAQALGHAAIRAGFQVLYCSIFDLVRELQADQSPVDAQRTLTRYLKPDLLCIDDFGMKHFPPKSAEALLELVVRRHQNRSTLLTSNRPIEEWGSCSGMCLPPPPFWIASSSRPKSFPSPVAATACAKHSPPPRSWKPRPPNPRRNQPTSRKRNDEFFALCLGLQRHPKTQKDPDRVSPQSGPDAITAIQGRSGARVALLQSPIPRTVLAAHHKV